ncbi:MAG: hypothetical protein Q7S44_04115 [bacterium]|nr:hypothetical protein [bacterium]
MLPKHKYLLTYRYSEIIHDLVVIFIKRYVLGNLSHLGTPDKRSADQMLQAARSGKQKKLLLKRVGIVKTCLKEGLRLNLSDLGNLNLPL